MKIVLFEGGAAGREARILGEDPVAPRGHERMLASTVPGCGGGASGKTSPAKNRLLREVADMVEPQGHLVDTYEMEYCTVEIYDAAYAGKSEEELERIRWEARLIACDIIDRAARRGVKV